MCSIADRDRRVGASTEEGSVEGLRGGKDANAAGLASAAYALVERQETCTARIQVWMMGGGGGEEAHVGTDGMRLCVEVKKS